MKTLQYQQNNYLINKTAMTHLINDLTSSFCCYYAKRWQKNDKVANLKRQLIFLRAVLKLRHNNGELLN